MKLFPFLFTVMLLMNDLNGIAQNEATTKDGKKVYLFDNGTWKYVDTAKVDQIQTSFECSDIISTNTDKITGRTSIMAKESIVVSNDGGKTGLGIIVFKIEESIVVSITAAGAGSCIDDDDKMNVLFRDGTRLELINNGKYNCDAKFTLYLGGAFGKKKELELFKTKEIESIRVWTSSSYVEKDLTPEQSKELMKTIECLAKS
jgi:hypothetical protein